MKWLCNCLSCFFFLDRCVSQIGELLPFEWVSVNFASTGHLLSIAIYESLWNLWDWKIVTDPGSFPRWGHYVKNKIKEGNICRTEGFQKTLDSTCCPSLYLNHFNPHYFLLLWISLWYKLHNQSHESMPRPFNVCGLSLCPSDNLAISFCIIHICDN